MIGSIHSNKLKQFSAAADMKYRLYLLLLLFIPGITIAQQKAADSTEKVEVQIVNAGSAELVTTDSNSFNKLLDDVALRQGDTRMYCDSAYLNTQTNNVEAFGNVIIIQPDGTEARSDYLEYTGNSKLAFLYGHVILTDGTDRLWAQSAQYNLNTKVGVYSRGGTLQSGTTSLSSISGVYNINSKDARFTNDVYVYDPEYVILSDDMGYNTDSKIVTFFGESDVTSDSSVLNTHCGTYDTKSETAYFPCRSSVTTREQYLEADTIDYSRTTGLGYARGDVIAIDTVQKLTMYSGKSYINEIKKTTLAVVKPVLKQINGNDSLFIRADTFFTAPVIPVPDSIKVVKTVGKGRKKKEIVEMIADTTAVKDTADLRYFIGYHNVKIFSDSMQGLCDSIAYSQKDSVMRMMYDPIVWSRRSQITGDTILLYMDSSEVEKMYVPDKAFVVSQSGPEKAGLFDQIQGKTLTGYFEDNAIREIIVTPNAEVIYYSQDDDGAYIGVNEATSARLTGRFKDNDILSITLEQDVKQTLTPLEQANIPGLKLKRFNWQDEKRPKELAELFE